MREMEGWERERRTFQPFKGIRRAEIGQIGDLDARSLLETKKFENPAISKCILCGFNSADGLLYACFTLIRGLCSI
jgi:hypothetical protein